MNERNQTELPIGFMDSGLGGLSVLAEAIKEMPAEDFLYFGDSANAPYGVRPREEIKALTYRVVEMLIERGIKGLAVACNTATGAAVRSLRSDYPDLPIVGIEPAIKPAVEKTKGGRIIVLATPMTIAQEKYRALVERFKGDTDLVSVPCPGLMEFVEEGDLNESELKAYFDKHLSPFLTEDTETIVLGCTHYPFIRRELKGFLKRPIDIIDGSLGTARELKRRLKEKNLLRPENGGAGRETGLPDNNVIGEKNGLSETAGAGGENARQGKIVIENSAGPEMIKRSRQLLKAAGIQIPE